jgi:hypothetical protein
MDFSNYLGNFSFLPIGQVTMWEMFLVAFVKVKHAQHLKNYQQGSVAAGVGGVVGNKGGLQLSFKIYDYLFNVINVHLVHGAKRFEKRNEMMSELIKKMHLQREEIDPDVIGDFNFIVGDMNYRMKGHTFESLVPMIHKAVEIRKNHD